MKDPGNGIAVTSGSKSGRASAESTSSPASLGSKLKLNPPLSPPLRVCSVRSKSGNGLTYVVATGT